MRLILASSSSYRQAQLKQLGLDFLSLSPEADEDQFKNKDIAPLELSRVLSELKGQGLSEKYPDDLILSGDQVCALGKTIFSKPGTKENAHQQLLKLQGQTHQLMTSFTLTQKGITETFTTIANLKMTALTAEQIERYLQQDQPYQCCGSYRLEALGISLFDSIDCDDHTAIIGLPLISLSRALRNRGFLIP